jgi:hypothetical protein
MASTFPTTKDTFEVPTATSPRNNPSLVDAYNLTTDAVAQLETKVGINSSADASSLDYQINNLVTTDITDITATAAEINKLAGLDTTKTEL